MILNCQNEKLHIGLDEPLNLEQVLAPLYEAIPKSLRLKVTESNFYTQVQLYKSEIIRKSIEETKYEEFMKNGQFNEKETTRINTVMADYYNAKSDLEMINFEIENRKKPIGKRVALNPKTQSTHKKLTKKVLLEYKNNAKKIMHNSLDILTSKIIDMNPEDRYRKRRRRERVVKEYVRFELDKHEFDTLEIDGGHFGKHPLWVGMLASFMGLPSHMVGQALIHDTVEDKLPIFEEYLKINSQLTEDTIIEDVVKNSKMRSFKEYEEFDSWYKHWNNQSSNGNGSTYFKGITVDNMVENRAKIKDHFIKIYEKELTQRFTKVNLKAQSKRFNGTILRLVTRLKDNSYKSYAEEMSDELKYSKENREWAMVIKLMDVSINDLTSFFYNPAKKAKTKFKELIARVNAQEYGLKRREKSNSYNTLQEMIHFNTIMSYSELDKNIRNLNTLVETKEQVRNQKVIDEHTRNGDYYKITQVDPTQKKPMYQYVGFDGLMQRLELFLYKVLPDNLEKERIHLKKRLTDYPESADFTFRAFQRLDEYFIFCKNFNIKGFKGELNKTYDTKT